VLRSCEQSDGVGELVGLSHIRMYSYSEDVDSQFCRSLEMNRCIVKERNLARRLRSQENWAMKIGNSWTFQSEFCEEVNHQ
jgi:hypothetical protein